MARRSIAQALELDTSLNSPPRPRGQVSPVRAQATGLFPHAQRGDAYCVSDGDTRYASLGDLAAPRAALRLPSVAERTRGCPSRWNGRLQRLVAQIPTSPGQARARFRSLGALYAEFGDAALAFCLSLPDEAPTEPAVSEDGELVAVRVRPLARLWDGCGTSEHKALKNLLLAHRCLLQHAQGDVHVPLTVAVDLGPGRRYRVQASCASLAGADPSLGDAKECSLPGAVNVRALPADCTCVRDERGRLFLLDLHRLLPPSLPAQRIAVTLLPADPLQPAVDVPVPVGFEPDESLDMKWRHVTRVLHKQLGPKIWHVALPDPRRRLFVSAGSTAPNARASALAGPGQQVQGAACLVLFCGAAHEVLFDLLRPELLLLSQAGEPIVADAFTAWCKKDHALGVFQVSAAHRRLVTQALPAAAAECDEAGLVDPAEIKKALHRHGASLRCLGQLRALLASDTCRAHVLLEMVARATRSWGWGDGDGDGDWCVAIKSRVASAFAEALLPFEEDWAYDLRRSLPGGFEPLLAARVAWLNGPRVKTPLSLDGGIPQRWSADRVAVEAALRARVDANPLALVDFWGDDPSHAAEGLAVLALDGLERGRYLLRIGDPHAAIEALPPDAHAELGRARLMLGDADEAARLLALAPPSLELAEALMLRGDLDAALEAVPGDDGPAERLFRARCLQAQGQVHTAADLIASVDLSPSALDEVDDPDEAAALGRALMLRGQEGDAALCVALRDRVFGAPSFGTADARFALGPEHFEAYLRDVGSPSVFYCGAPCVAAYALGVRLGGGSCSSGGGGGGEGYLRLALRVLRDVPDCSVREADVHAQLGGAEHLGRAVELYRAADPPVDPEVLARALFHWAATQAPEVAIPALEEASQLHKGDNSILLALAELQPDAGAALSSYQAALETAGAAGGEAFNITFNMAALLEEQGDREQALARYEACRALEPTGRPGEPTMADALLRAAALASGDFERCAELLRAAGDAPGAEAQLGLLLASRGDPEAKSLLQAAFERRQGPRGSLPEGAAHALGTLLMRDGDYAGALAPLRVALASSDPDSHTHVELLAACGDACDQVGDYAAAADFWGRAVDTDLGDLPVLLQRLGEARKAAGDPLGAAEAFLKSGVPELRLEAAAQLFAGGEAEASLRQLLQCETGCEGALGPVAAAVADPTVVVELLERRRPSRPEMLAEVLTALAVAAQRGGLQQTALDAFLELLQLRGASHPAYVDLCGAAAAIAFSEQDLDLAAELLQKGVAAGGSRLLVNLVAVQGARGKHEEALGAVDELLSSGPDSADPAAEVQLRRARAQALLSLGREGEAKEELRGVLERFALPDEERAALEAFISAS